MWHNSVYKCCTVSHCTYSPFATVWLIEYGFTELFLWHLRWQCKRFLMPIKLLLIELNDNTNDNTKQRYFRICQPTFGWQIRKWKRKLHWLPCYGRLLLLSFYVEYGRAHGGFMRHWATSIRLNNKGAGVRSLFIYCPSAQTGDTERFWNADHALSAWWGQVSRQ